METINVISSIIIFLYLVVVFLIKYYINLLRKKEGREPININKLNPTVSLYCTNLLSANKLFWITLYELIENDYYKLEENILETGSKYRKIELVGYQKALVKYIDKCLNKDLNDIDDISRSDVNFGHTLMTYIEALKKYTKEHIGALDRFSTYISSIVVTFLYSNQVLYFLSEDINLFGRVLISLPFTFISVVIADLLKNRFKKHSILKYILVFAISLTVSILTSNIWNADYNNNYLIFHFIMGVFTYMYPLLIIIDLYYIRTNSIYNNKLQKSIIDQMDTSKNYIYAKVMNLDINKSNKRIDEFFKIFNI